MGYIDLHTHTTYSDGTFSVLELVNLAKEMDVSILSITDHDNIDGLLEAKKICDSLNIKFINGVELSATFNNEEVHILAYGFDLNSPLLNDFLLKAKELRSIRNDTILEKLKSIGIEIDKNKLMENKDCVITRADIAAEIVNLGFCENSNEAFFKYLAKNKFCYVTKNMPDVSVVLKLIHDIGAISSIAHPTAYNFYNTNLKGSLSSLKKDGLDAIECYHSSYSMESTNTLLGYTNRLNLLKTAGSDFHGSKKVNVNLSKTSQNLQITEDMIFEFINKVNFA